MLRRDALPSRILSALVTLAMVTALVPKEALAEVVGGGGVL